MGELATVETLRDAKTAEPQSMGEAGALISMIERAARDPAVNIDKFERLMGMKERAMTNAARVAFETAIAAAKGEIPPIVKNRSVDFTSQRGRTNYRYEDLAEIARVVDPILSRHGLAYRHRSTQAGGKVSVTCVMSHALGHIDETTLEASEDHTGNKNSIQAIGSTATFLQRYTLKLALGIASTIDDDGRNSGAAPATTITNDEEQALYERIMTTGVTSIAGICKYFGVAALAEIRSADLPRAYSAIDKKISQKVAQS